MRVNPFLDGKAGTRVGVCHYIVVEKFHSNKVWRFARMVDKTYAGKIALHFQRTRYLADKRRTQRNKADESHDTENDHDVVKYSRNIVRPVDCGTEQGIKQKQCDKQAALAGIGGRIVETVFHGVKEVAEIGTSVEVIIAWISHGNTFPAVI